MQAGTEPRYIRITDFGEHGIPEGHEFTTPDVIEPECKLFANDLLFARSGATVGKTYLHQDTSHTAIFAGYCIRFRFNPHKALPKFVWFFTKTGAFARWILITQRPSGQPNINKEEFKSAEMPVPPLQVQSQLVAAMEAALEERWVKLAEADALLGSFDRYLLDTLGVTPPPLIARQAYAVRFKEITGTRFDAQYHQPYYARVTTALAACRYRRVSLGVISPEIVGGATPTRGDQELYTRSGIRFLRILNVKPNEIVEDDMKFIQEHVHEADLKRSQLAPDDILMTITGRVGTAAVVPAEILPANINQHIVRLRLPSDDCLPAYLAAFLNSSFGLTLSNRGVTGGTRIALDYGAIRALQIPVPPPGVQEQIVRELRRRREDASRLRAEAETNWQAAKRWFEEQLLKPAAPARVVAEATQT